MEIVARGWLRLAQRAWGLSVWVWVVALCAAPAALQPVGAFICHQRTERSFFVAGTQLPVCARCLGLYAGAALSVPLALLIATPMASSRARSILLVSALPTAITWSLEFAGVGHFSNVARFGAALPLGFAANWLVLSTMADSSPRP